MEVSSSTVPAESTSSTSEKLSLTPPMIEEHENNLLVREIGHTLDCQKGKRETVMKSMNVMRIEIIITDIDHTVDID